jgi:hypothetical protein
VGGVNSIWDVASQLGIGVDFSGTNSGAVTVRIQSGGAVNVVDKITLHDDDELRLEGGALRARTIEFLGSTAPFVWSFGRLSLDAIQISTLNILNGGVLAPGRELGETFIEGSLRSNVGATTEIQIGGTTPGVTFDRVRVTDGITLLGGNLAVSLLNGFVPAPTDAFNVMSSQIGAFTGSFANIPSGQRLTTSDGLGSFLVSYGPGSPQVVLSSFLSISLPGDFDLDGDVDGRDFLMWQRGGSPSPLSAGDLANWQANYGAGSLTASVAVPEPSTATACVIAFSAYARLRRRDRPNSK